MAKGRRIIALIFCFLSIFSCRPRVKTYPYPKVKPGVISIIPLPAKMEIADGVFTLSPSTKLLFETNSSEARKVADYLKSLFSKATGFDFKIESSSKKSAPSDTILLTSRSANYYLGSEGYELKVSSKSIVIRAAKAAGLFYGVQTLRQLLPAEIESSEVVKGRRWNIPCVRIEDKPRFHWRGMHLDVSRHFFGKEFIKRYIDYLALHKLNTFHWHLTDDNGWRIEVKKYPRLTEVGAWRVDREDKPWNEREPQREGERATYGGFYTQEDIQEIVAYAQSRFVTIVPEIEMPAHSVAALAAYPEYSCTGGPFTVRPGAYWPNADIYCAGNDETFKFLEDILSEVIELFPGRYVHIGGDEAYKANWEKCPKCQSRMEREGLKDVQELQSYFIHRIEKFLSSKGKRTIGWDEILEGGLAPEATVMSWRGPEGGIMAARSGHYVVMSPTSHCYFDYYQAKTEQPEAIGGYLPLEKVYSFEPIPPEFDPDSSTYILGAQGNVWTEYIPNPQHAEYMVFPRLCALAEVVWSEKNQRNYDDFISRLNKCYERLDKMGVNYYLIAPSFNPPKEIAFIDAAKSIQVEIEKSFPGTVHYTLDGSDPTADSTIYIQPLTVTGDAILKARTFLPNQRKSNVSVAQLYFVERNANGMDYEYYEGQWEALPDFSLLKPLRKGRAYDFDLDYIEREEDFYALRFAGYINILLDGEYTFYISSDDGSNLLIGETLLVDNNGLHGMREVSGKITLSSGLHPITVLYFENSGAESLEVLYEGPGIEKQKIPPPMIYRDKTGK